MIFPTYLSAPMRSGKDENGKNWNKVSQPFINNCRTLSPSASIPEMTIPIGYHSRGAGIGMEVAALRGQEQLLLDIAYSFTNAKDYRVAPTGAPNDYKDFYAGNVTELLTPEPPEETVEETTVATKPENDPVQNEEKPVTLQSSL